MVDVKVEPLVPGDVDELRVELLPLSFLARRGDRIRSELTNQDSMTTDAPMTRFCETEVGTDTYHHDGAAPLDAPPA
jgi:hypothetical protein